MKLKISNKTKDIINTLIFNVTKIFTGPISLVLIPYFLTKQMQGFWYSFISISALSILVDLGFTVIISQFSSHEFSKLRFNNEGIIIGDLYAYNKLASLLKVVLNRGLKIIIIAYPLILIVGFYVLSGEFVGFSWKTPWVVYTIASGAKFFVSIILAFFEGCNEISKVQKIRYKSSIFFFFCNCSCLVLHFGLYALAIANLLDSIFLIVQLWINFKKPIKQLLYNDFEFYDWAPELFSLLWKYAISWVSGYLIFQLYTPIAFKKFGSVYAGQVGLTITLITAIFSISNIWIYVITPKINMLVAQKNWKVLDSVFKKHLILSLFSFLLISIVFLICYYLLYYLSYQELLVRIIIPENIIGLLIAWFIQLLINSIATYSRAYKEEPYVIPSLFTGLYIAISTFVLAFYFEKQYLFVGFYSSFIFSLPWFLTIYIKRKRVMQVVE